MYYFADAFFDRNLRIRTNFFVKYPLTLHGARFQTIFGGYVYFFRK